MYSLQQLYGRIIWNFRDPRSGSTWFLYNLSVKLIRTSHFFDIINPNIFGIYNSDYYTDPTNNDKDSTISNFFSNRNQEKTDAFKILNTHEYAALKSIHNYENPILVRNVRKNKTQQFASLVVANLTTNYNVHSSKVRDNLPKLEPMIIDRTRINYFVNRLKESEKLWQLYATQYENETVYYEDLLTGWESKIFPINMIMTDNQNEDKNTKIRPLSHVHGTPLKLPYNYQEIIINYDEIDYILKNELGTY